MADNHEFCIEHHEVKWKASLNLIIQVIALGVLSGVLLVLMEIRGDIKVQQVITNQLMATLQDHGVRINRLEVSVKP